MLDGTWSIIVLDGTWSIIVLDGTWSIIVLEIRYLEYHCVRNKIPGVSLC